MKPARLDCRHGPDLLRHRRIRVHPADDLHQRRPSEADTDLGGARRGRLIAITQGKSWKVKRIRNTSRVTIAKCDRRGKPLGEAVDAVAKVDPARAGDAYDAIGERYGLLGKTFNFFSKLRGGMKNNVAVEIKSA